MQSIIDEPVRGVFGDFSWLRLSGFGACRLFVRGELPAPPIHHLTGLTPTEAGLGTPPAGGWAHGMGSALVIPGGIEALKMGRPVEDMFDLADPG